MRSGKSNLSDLEILREVMDQRDAAYQALNEARQVVANLRSKMAELETAARTSREALEVGRKVMERFPDQASFDAAINGTADGTEPGVSPLNDLESWRRSQLGLPALPAPQVVCDDDELTLEDISAWAKEHGGTAVLTEDGDNSRVTGVYFNSDGLKRLGQFVKWPGVIPDPPPKLRKSGPGDLSDGKAEQARA